MEFRGDVRGVTVQVGAVLLLGILVISLSVFQTTVVPDENKQVEFQHNQQVQEDMQSFRSAVTRTSGTGLTQSVAVRLGTQYPERALFINPPPPTGTLQTADNGDITIQNARALDDETADYWDSTERTFTTTQVSYSPTYHVYQNAPTTVYESGVLFNRFDGGETVPQSEQSIVNGRTITLVAVDGELSRSQLGSVAVDVRPKSVSQRTVTVEEDTAPITIAVPSTLSAATWRDELLAGELDTDGADSGTDDGRYVVAVTDTESGVELELESGYQYNLNLAKVGVGTGGGDTTATYLTAVSGDGATVAEGGEQQLVVEVRDAFNNPVSGQSVSASVTAGPGSIDSSPVTTESDGRAVFTYSAPPGVDGSQSVTVTAEFGDSPGAKEQVEFDLSVADSDGSGSGGSSGDNINPSKQNDVKLENAIIVAQSGNQVESVVDVIFNNPDSSDRIMTEVRFNFYDEDSQNGQTNPPESVNFDSKGTLNVRGEYVTVDRTLTPGDNTLSLRFYKQQGGGGSEFDVDEGDFFILTVKYDDGVISTYFIAPANE